MIKEITIRVDASESTVDDLCDMLRFQSMRYALEEVREQMFRTARNFTDDRLISVFESVGASKEDLVDAMEVRFTEIMDKWSLSV